ncbi:arylsulfotransferase family protein [Candidatus Thiosymbion oneisti]|uniref:arylsulfotransferase family protein n=1 Tax=Candidatus Thiosymbion oneisti TaxID=589554 RepID=UPI00106135A1|nr:arylsulfotransferase family protein [Candidatus Thiosymbion oneisti]
MKRYLPVFGIIWLVALVCFIWGAAMVYYDIFPSRLLKPSFRQIIAFWKGHPADKRSVAQRFKDGLMFDPLAFAVSPSPFPMQLQFRSVDTSSYRGPSIESLDQARYYSDAGRKEYFLIYGSFTFEDTHWGAILISTEGRIVRGWSIKPRQYRKIYGGIGLALSKTGDLATNTYGVLTSYSWCGEKKWEADPIKPSALDLSKLPSSFYRNYHHEITYNEGKFYTFYGPEIVSVDGNTGEIMERIHLAELIRWARDQDLAIFDAFKAPPVSAGEYPLHITRAELFHPNKVDVLSRDLADSFDDFEAGDLLISLRRLNLVFVFRPKTSKILWYRYGLTSSQHDATFQRGYIAVFDNNPFANSGPNPRIVTLGVKDHSRSVLFDLKTWGVTMRAKGNFEFDDDNNLLVFADEDNGRVVVGHLSGKPMFIFENRVGPGKNLGLINITRLSPRKVEDWNSQCN